MDWETEHGAIAWGNFLAQYDSSPVLESFVRALYAPAEELERAYDALINERGLENAIGQQLDGIGEIVGQSRIVDDLLYARFFGFEGQPGIAGFSDGGRMRREGESPVAGSSRLLDAEYRKVLYWKIAVNNGHGTSPEIAAITKIIFDATIVRIRNLGNAKLSVWFNRTMALNPAFMIDPIRWIPAAAGVGVTITTTTTDKPFGFVSQGFYGFGEGVLSRS